MPCMFITSCNRKVRGDFFDKYCASEKNYYVYCDEYKGVLDPEKRPAFWANEKNIIVQEKEINEES